LIGVSNWGGVVSDFAMNAILEKVRDRA